MLSPEASPVPIIALPISRMTARTSAKSRLMRPSLTIRSVMMGTGEASGEKRALTAAEAAIANPLIDDASMKGARGLLISITGGKDLTLFEVDEAATRIREEVDQDANIIVGATFDEGLDGVIRVSVVATGIEQAMIARNAPPSPATLGSAAPENRLADLTARLRADNARLA